MPSLNATAPSNQRYRDVEAPVQWPPSNDPCLNGPTHRDWDENQIYISVPCPAVYPDSSVSGSFQVPYGAISGRVYVWIPEGSLPPNITVYGQPQQVLLGDNAQLCWGDYCQPSVSTYAVFSPQSNMAEPADLTIVNANPKVVPGPGDGGGGLSFFFGNVTISYSEPGSVDDGGAASSGVPPPLPSGSVPSSQSIGNATSQPSSQSNGGHHSNAAVIVPAVVCPIVAVVAVTAILLWWLRYKRRLAPSAAFRANPETPAAWVPIDEKRNPEPAPGI
ncbi:hypothetical protein AURDEDRAFT_114896 [Auricularia subglabra TFB-10046 SS5]|nr:hypothetical protein AURDEDRAFT_114896 [Auricularia subglabra TFB-10046 SS5]